MITKTPTTISLDRGRQLHLPATWKLFLAVGVIAIGLFFVGPTETKSVLFFSLSFVAFLSAIVGIRLHRTTGPLPWLFFAGALGAQVVGNFFWSIYYPLIRLAPPPNPGVSDFIYLTYAPLVAIGLIILIRRNLPRRDLPALIDAAIVTVGVAVTLLITVIDPYLHDSSISTAARTIAIAYPTMDVLVLAVALRFVFSRGRRNSAFRLLSFILAAYLVGDTGYTFLLISGHYQFGTISDGGWLLSSVLWGVLFLHPFLQKKTTPEPSKEISNPWIRLAALACASVIVPAIAVLKLRADHSHITLFVMASTLTFLLILGRVGLLMHQNLRDEEALRARQTQLTSALLDVQALQSERQRLLDQSVRSGESERTRLAAELHDGPVQSLTGLAFRLAEARLLMNQKHLDAEATLDSLETGLSEEIGGIRRLMAELRPPALDERGLSAALRDHVSDFSQHSDVACHFDAAINGDLGYEAATVFYRVAQEALNNVARHAAANNVWVSVGRVNGSAFLEVRDDGHGFDPRSNADSSVEHFGLIGMRHRVEMLGGEFEVDSRPDNGTRLKAVLPMEVNLQ